MAQAIPDWFLSLIMAEIKKSGKPYNSETLTGVTQTVLRRSGQAFLQLIKSNKKSLNQMRLYRNQFERRLIKRWKKPIDLLEILIQLCLEEEAKLNYQYRQTAAKTSDYVFDVLTKLHARACQTSSEVLCLLKSGFADGAHARWRTLHEMAVISCFIKKQGQDVAKRYLYYEAIENYKDAIEYQKHCLEIGYEPLTDEEFEMVKRRSDVAIQRFGNDFNKYGWIPKDILKQRKFVEIERYVKLDRLQPYYKMACHKVHSGPKELTVKLGLLEKGSQSQVLQAGPSNYGLADPAQCTAISLNQITTCLLSTRPTPNRLTAMMAMQKLVEEICTAFCKVQSQIESEERNRAQVQA